MSNDRVMTNSDFNM